MYNIDIKDEKGEEIMHFAKKILFFTVMFLVFAGMAGNLSCQAKTIKKEIEVETKDAYILKATLSYTKIEGAKKYPTVLLLHSLGYSSINWGTLIDDLNYAGFAVIAMDFRGHGKSVYNANLQQKSWVYLKPKAYQKFPNDVYTLLMAAQAQSKVVSLDNMAIIGADIGANTAIMTCKLLPKKPKALVLISGLTTFKGLYVPVTLAEIGKIPILSIASIQDGYSLQEQAKLSKFSQGAFYVKNYPFGGMGMLMLKSNPNMSREITNWLTKFFK